MVTKRRASAAITTQGDRAGKQLLDIHRLRPHPLRRLNKRDLKIRKQIRGAAKKIAKEHRRDGLVHVYRSLIRSLTVAAPGALGIDALMVYPDEREDQRARNFVLFGVCWLIDSEANLQLNLDLE